MVYIFLADGFETIEALTPIDVLRRANVDIKTVGINSSVIRSSHNVPIITDMTIEDLKQKFKGENRDIEMIILPGGGKGTTLLEECEYLGEIIAYCVKSNIYIAAICAAPSILGHRGYLDGLNATCFPSFKEEIGFAKYIDQPVVCDKNIITSRGAGVSLDFGLMLVEKLISREESNRIKGEMQS